MNRQKHLLWAFSTLALGGPQRRCLTLIGTLGDEFRHSFHAMDGCYDALAELDDTVSVNQLDVPMVKGGLVARENINAMRSILSAHQPDLLLTSNWGAIEWIAANRGAAAVPQIHFEDGFGPDERPDKQNKKRVWARRAFFKSKPDLRFVAPSHVLADVFGRYWWVPERKVSLIPNGVDCSRFNPSPRGNGALVVGTVAALRAEKRIDRLIDAFANSAPKDARLLIVGDGNEADALKSQAQELGLSERIEFAGNQADVAPFLARMDIYAMSSDTEQMPISLVEGMAAGLPVAATDVGDIARMVCPENKPLIETVHEADALSASLKTLFDDTDLRQSLGRQNAAKARAEYDLAAMTNSYRTLFEKTMTL